MLGDAEQRTRYAQAEVEVAEDCVSETQTRTCGGDGWGTWSGSYTAETCMVVISEDCDGMEEMRTRYEDLVVPYGEECASEIQTRSCTGDAWSGWSGTFEQESCTVAAAADCEGAEHGQDASRVRYETESVPYGEACESETQSAACDNGVLGAWSGTYTFASCEPEPGLPCGDVASGEQEMRMRYETDSVSFGQTCTAETQARTCTNGTFGDWSGTYTFDACVVEDPIDCMDGLHGEERMRIRYQATTVPWGTTCASEQQTQTCWNGDWLDWTGTYAFDACAVADPVDCAGGTHGSSQMRTRYATADVPNGSTCQDETQMRTCTNGTWGAWSGTFTHDNCVVLPPFAGSCTFYNAGTAYGCLDAIGSGYTAETVMATCSAGNVYSASHCAGGAALLGTCALELIETFEQVQYYYLSAVYPDAATAQNDCTVRSGSWTAP